jgi:phosphoesterase RecJ-like protein
MTPVFDKSQLAEITALLGPASRVVILPHHKPDGDAMGAALAVYNYLRERVGKVTVISPGDFPDFLRWMAGSPSVLLSDGHAAECDKLLAEADVVFCLDFNAPDRVNSLEKGLTASPATKILIDHHLAPQPFCRYMFSHPEASSTCELIYHFIMQSAGRDALTQPIAECLYAGIMTDTGSFRFSSMHADTHRVVGDLIDAGVENHKIHERIFDNFSEHRTRFLGYCIKDKLVVLKEFNTAYISVTMEEMKRYRYEPGDTEGFVNYGLGIKGIRMAAFFCERPNIVKISFRSKGDFSVKDIAATHFEGGGHKNAAGGKSRRSLSETVDHFLSLLPGYKDDLTA